jgi:hypothetical protein
LHPLTKEPDSEKFIKMAGSPHSFYNYRGGLIRLLHCRRSKAIAPSPNSDLALLQLLLARAIAATLTKTLDLDEVLLLGIQSLALALPEAPVKSREGAAGAMARLIETYRKFHPMTTAELVDLAIALPGFDPREFAQTLRDRLERGDRPVSGSWVSTDWLLLYGVFWGAIVAVKPGQSFTSRNI